ncbi:hypothetical protein SUGI_0054880 [Cryptomeria japonica]|nr:hypothetical protein SUGI_0054880 [Cryptomeria japonica]
MAYHYGWDPMERGTTRAGGDCVGPYDNIPPGGRLAGGYIERKSIAAGGSGNGLGLATSYVCALAAFIGGAYAFAADALVATGSTTGLTSGSTG